MKKLLAAGAVVTALGAGTAAYLNQPEPTGHLYMMRGLLGGEGFQFSRGVDVLAAKAEAAHKVAVKTDSWRKSAEMCEAAKAAYKRDKKPVFLSGHSLGANAAVKVAHCLNDAGVPVAFLMALDPTPLVSCVPANVKYATSWRRSFPLDLGGGYIVRCGGSKQNLANITVRTRHTVLDDLPSVHQAVLKRIEIGLK